MCGIIGFISNKNVAERLIEGLKRLEYRGYDSAGIAVIDSDEIKILRSEGKIVNLEKKLEKSKVDGLIGIGHTRWATHGLPTENNAHPHSTKTIAVVHNGIIENFVELREFLTDKGYRFKTETDTEVVPYLIEYYLKEFKDIKKAIAETYQKLKGAFAFGILFLNEEILVAIKKGSPLAIGFGEGEMMIGSDALALSPFTNKITFLEDGDIAILTTKKMEIFDVNFAEIKREVKTLNTDLISISKGNYKHFMLKEIYEQPSIISNNLRNYYDPINNKIFFDDLGKTTKKISDVYIIACGTSYFAGMVGKYLLSEVSGINLHLEIASEFRYREITLKRNSLGIFISQSGETADTLAALEYFKKQNGKTISLTNVENSSIARKADYNLNILAGPEIGVASTKAFTAQIMVLTLLGIFITAKLRHLRKKYSAADVFAEMPSHLLQVFEQEKKIKKIAQVLSKYHSILYVGRDVLYPIALEGALKLKELSYIHAEAYALGELKHGPIALIDENMPVIALVSSADSTIFEKTVSNIREIASRQGKIIIIGDKKAIEPLKDVAFDQIEIPESNKAATPILFTVPVQLLAYHIAVIKGTDVDQPRNLAKSVTVE
ncbi:MAG: glutamine--fructose-6-phosphate transaminase (isomerizing) [Alphaproteobacteria bacterium]|jgi:glucosamine--fructose-6-phosphate aminotransferase (isomerizing)